MLGIGILLEFQVDQFFVPTSSREKHPLFQKALDTGYCLSLHARLGLFQKPSLIRARFIHRRTYSRTTARIFCLPWMTSHLLHLEVRLLARWFGTGICWWLIMFLPVFPPSSTVTRHHLAVEREPWGPRAQLGERHLSIEIAGGYTVQAAKCSLNSSCSIVFTFQKGKRPPRASLFTSGMASTIRMSCCIFGGVGTLAGMEEPQGYGRSPSEQLTQESGGGRSAFEFLNWQFSQTY